VNADHTVLGYVDENLALNKPASQVNTFQNDVASQAVDGLQDTSSCTDGAAYPWFSVDLGAAYDVGHVTVTNNRNTAKGKVLPYSIPSVGCGADPSLRVVSLQVTLSNPPSGRLPLLSARHAVTSVAFTRWHQPYTR